MNIFERWLAKWRRPDPSLAALHRLETAMSEQTEYMTTALASLDTQMGNLQTRLADDAAALAAALAAVTVGAEEGAALEAAALRVQTTAELVSTLARPTAVADPDAPDAVADPLL